MRWKNKRIFVSFLEKKMTWLFIYSFVLNILLFLYTNNWTQEGFFNLLDLPQEKLAIDGADFSIFAIGLTALLNAMILSSTIVFTFIWNLLLFTITTVVFHIFYFRSVAAEKAAYLQCLKITIISIPILGTVLLVIINPNAFPLNIFFILTYYLLFSAVSGILIWVRTKRVYSTYEISIQSETL